MCSFMSIASRISFKPRVAAAPGHSEPAEPKTDQEVAHYRIIAHCVVTISFSSPHVLDSLVVRYPPAYHR